MTRIVRSESDRNAQFRWQMDFLRASTERYERGFENEAIRMATVLRICFHDKGASRSLFGQMGLLDQLLWLDTTPVGPRPPWGFLHFVAPNGYVGRLSAPVNALPDCPRVPFSDWWTQPVLTDSDKHWYSREDLVLYVVNQDGGAHIDPRISAQYYRLSRGIALGSPAQTHRADIIMQSPAWEAIRQIVFEVQETLYTATDYNPWLLPTARESTLEGIPRVLISNLSVDAGYGEQPVYASQPDPELVRRMDAVGFGAIPTSQTPREEFWTPEIAEELAQRYLADMGDRWLHAQGVGRRAASARELRPDAVSERTVVAAWLHDIGYSSIARLTGFHSLDGAIKLRQLQAPESVASLVAHHSGATFEASERGLGASLDEFAAPDCEDLDMLTYFDMTTSPQGQEVLVQDRLREIRQRYDPDHFVHKAIERSAPEILDSCARALARLDQPINGISSCSSP